MKYKICAVLLLLMSTLAVQAEVKTMRCNTKLVAVGDRNFEVERKCGEPDMRNFVGYTGESAKGDMPIEEWVYNRTKGSNSFILLRFVGGKLDKIESYYPTN